MRGYGFMSSITNPASDFYKRYFTISSASSQLKICENVMSESSTLIKASDIKHLTDVNDYSASESTQTLCEWKYTFRIVTKNQELVIFVRTAEEQFIWLASFMRIFKVETKDPNYSIP